MRKAINIYRENRVSYVDAYLAAYTLAEREGEVYSFDKGLGRVKGLRVNKP